MSFRIWTVLQLTKRDLHFNSFKSQFPTASEAQIANNDVSVVTRGQDTILFYSWWYISISRKNMSDQIFVIIYLQS
jgi:hypothetical protein